MTRFSTEGSPMPKILAFSGSIRRDSWNRKLIRTAVDATQAAGGDVSLIDLADYPLPLYNGDLEDKEGLPDNALRLKALFKEHDALLIASPEYNSSIPPLLKNTLDCVSREWQGESGLVPYQNKVAAILAASPGTFGGMRMLPHLRQILNTLGVLVLPGQFSLAHADTAFDMESGALKSPARLHTLVLELVNSTTVFTRARNQARHA
jgi:chromate reductase